MKNKSGFKKPRKVKEIIHNNSINKVDKDKLNIDNFINDIEINILVIKKILEDCGDVKYRTLEYSDKVMHIIYVEGMVDNHTMSEDILKVLLNNKEIFSEDRLLEETLKDCIPVGQVALIDSVESAVDQILSGSVLLLIEGHSSSVSIEIQGWSKRTITASQIEPTIQGSKESFIESLSTNLSLIRRRILDPDLKIKTFIVGNYSKTKVSILYVDSIVNTKLLDELYARIKRIDIDNILDSNYILELIRDSPTSPFPTVLKTERPDKVVGELMEGRIAVMQENTPDVLILPSVLMDYVQSPDDYYKSHYLSTFVRFLRYISFSISLLAPAVFVAVMTYHQEMIPSKLIVTLASQREGVPFPTALEAFSMLSAFEILREAGIRLPMPIGQTVSIVGALIIGEAAVAAGIVSPAVVIVIALTAISTFTLPSTQLDNTIILIRYVYLLAGSILGFWGIFLVILITMGHLSSLRSLGIPYLTPLSPYSSSDINILSGRAPWWGKLQTRPSYIAGKNVKRHTNKKPAPDKKKGNDSNG